MKKVEVDAKLVIMLISLVLVATVGASYTTYLIFSGDKGSATTGDSSASAQETVEPAELGPTYDLGSFTVNVVSTDGYRSKYLRVSIVVEVDDQNVIQELDKRNVQLKDAVVRVLRGETLESISTVAGTDELRVRLLDEMNQLLQTGEVVSVFFTEFVTQ